MSHFKPTLATIVGSAALLALLGASTDAQAGKKNPSARNAPSISNRMRFGRLTVTSRARTTFNHQSAIFVRRQALAFSAAGRRRVRAAHRDGQVI
jgi:hypothetical protein